MRLVNDILDIYKMEASQDVFNMKRVEVLSLIEQTIENNQALAEGDAVRIRLDGGNDVVAVRANPDRLTQVVTNLLSNAIKFSPVEGEVVVPVEKIADVVRILVRDHGPGISVDFKPHIFERFAQANATGARQKGGTGLGLSIVKQIVEWFCGEVGFPDAPGGGTIFHVDLPCWHSVITIAIDRDAPSESPRILLWEDDLDAAIVLRQQLKQFGFATDFAFDEDDALARAAAIQYRAILIARLNRRPHGNCQETLDISAGACIRAGRMNLRVAAVGMPLGRLFRYRLGDARPRWGEYIPKAEHSV